MKHKLHKIVLMLALLVCMAFGFASCTQEPASEEPVEYTVTFVLGEHAASGVQAPAQITAEENEQITLPAAVTAAEGWSFAGWTDGSTTYEAGENYTVTGNATFTAVWEEIPPEPVPVEYTVTFALGEHAASGVQAPAQITAEENTQITLPTAVAAAEGWSFAGWTDGGTTYEAGESYTVTENVTFTAEWKEVPPPAPVEYTVTFALGEHAASGVQAPAQVTAEENAKITLPAAVTAAEGWSFAGWTDGSATYEAGENYTVTGNATFTAVWEEDIPPAPIEYTVTFALGSHAAPGAQTPAQMTAEENEQIILPAAVAAAEGWSFAGWTDSSTTYEAGESYTVTKNVTLTAVWNVIRVAVRFDANGGTGTMAEDAFNWGDNYRFPAPAFTAPAGMEFFGWSPDRVTIYDTAISVGGYRAFISGNAITFYAVWREIAPVEYTVTFDIGAHAASGAQAPAPITAEAGAEITLPMPPAAEERWEFFGWGLDGYRYDPGETYVVTSDVTFTAIWALIMPELPETYPLTFYSGVYSGSGITGETPAAQQVEVGETVTLPASPWSREGYTFSGWKVERNTAAEGEEAVWEDIFDAVRQPGEEFAMPADEIRLTAVWQEVILAVHFDANGGSGTMQDASVVFGRTYFLPETAGFTAPEGMQFAGWSLDGKTLLDTAISRGDYAEYIEENAFTLYAVWEAIPVYSDIADVAGVWSNGGIELIISGAGADDTAGIAGTAISGGIGFSVYAMPDGTFAGYDFRNTAYAISFAEGMLTLTVTAGEGELQISVFEERRALSADAAQNTLGKWERSDTSQKWLIGRDAARYGASLSQASVLMIDRYVLLTYTAGIPYSYLLCAAGDGLSGTFYGDPEREAAEVTFRAGSFLTLTAEGELNQFVDAGSAPDADLLPVPQAPEGQTFEKWVIAGTQTEFDPAAAMTEDVSIEAVFAQFSAPEEVFEGEFSYSGSDPFTVVAFSVNFEEKTVSYRLKDGTEFVSEQSVTDYSNAAWKPAECEIYWEISMESSSFYIGFGTDRSALYLYNSNDEQLASFVQEGGETPVGTVTVTFVNGETVFATAEVSIGGRVAVPEGTPVSESGKAFRHWADENGAYDFDTPVTQELTLHAAFAWKVVFEAGEGATGSVEPAWVTMWTPGGILLPAADGLSNGTKQFAGWLYDGEVYGAGTRFAPENYAQLGNVTFTAVWEEQEPAPTAFEIAFTDADGTDYGTFTTTSTGWLNASNRPDDPKKQGFVFLYWALADGTKIELASHYFQADTTVYAIFSAAVANSEFVGVWSDGAHEAVITSLEGWDGQTLYAILDGKYFVYESPVAAGAERTFVNALDGAAFCTIGLSDGKLTVSYPSGDAFTIASRTASSAGDISFELLNGRTFADGTTQISFSTDDYGYYLVSVNGNTAWYINRIVGNYISLVLSGDYEIEDSYLLSLSGDTLSGYDAYGMHVSFAEVKEEEGTGISYDDGVLSYDDGSGSIQQLLFSLEATKGSASADSAAFSYEDGLFWLDLSMVSVDGLAADEKVIGFLMDGVAYAPDDVIGLTSQELYAVVEDTAFTFGSLEDAQWNVPQWQSVLRKGESAIYTGTMTSDAALYYNTIHVLLWQTLNNGAADGVVRLDWFVQGQDDNVVISEVPYVIRANVAAMNWTVTKRLLPDANTYLATVEKCRITVFLQWENPECLQIAYYVWGENGLSFPMIYEIRATTGSLPDWYYFGFTYEFSTVTLSRHETCDFGSDRFCEVCGMVDRTALDAAAASSVQPEDANGSVTVSEDFAVKATFTLSETATSSELFVEFQEKDVNNYFDYNFADLNFWGTLSDQPFRYVSGALPAGVARGTFTVYAYRIGSTLYLFLEYTPAGEEQAQFAMSLVQENFYTGEGVFRIAGGHSALEGLDVRAGTLA